MAATKEEFVRIVSALRDFVASDESKECTCPNTRCEFHGDCYNCVRIYRHFGQHVPRCLQHVLEKKIATISQVMSVEMGKREKTPDEFYEYLNTVMPKPALGRGRRADLKKSAPGGRKNQQRE